MGYTSGDEVYNIPTLAKILHSLPHLNVTFHRVNNTFDYKSPVYLESLGILGSIPAAWLILTLLVLLIYLLTRCCDRKPRPLKSISALKITLAVVSVLCCAAIGLGLYGNDDLHNGISQFLAEGKQVDQLFARIRNQTEAIERQLRVQANSQIAQIKDILDEPITNVNVNVTAKKQVIEWINMASGNNTLAANAATDIRRPLQSIHIAEKVVKGESIEAVRWPTTMALLSILLMLCVVLLVGVARHNRCALIAFSVCGLLAVIAAYVMASLYIATTVALADLCMAPDKFLQDQASTEVTKEILHYYTSCERARANPFTQRQREGKAAIQNMRTVLDYLKKPAMELYPRKGLDHKFSSLLNQVKEGDMLMTSLISLVDCKALYTHYLRGAKALCNVGLLGLSLMLASAILAGLLLTALVWIDSHTWIYIRKRKDYHQVNETESFLPAPAASQAIAARTLQRSQGSSYPPDTPPPSYTSAMMHNYLLEPSAPMHEAQTLIDGCDMRSAEHVGGRGGGGSGGGAHMSHLRGHTLGRLPSHHHEPLSGPNNGKAACKEFPNFKGFKFDQKAAQQQPPQQQQKQQQQQHHHQSDQHHRTANIQKFSSLGRRPLPQIPDEKSRKQPIAPKVPTTISHSIETPLNPANFRSLQRGAWQDTASVHQNLQFRSLQRGATSGQSHSQFRSVKIQDQTQNEATSMYGNAKGSSGGNNESERQLYAVTEL